MVTQYARVESSRVESSRVVPSALCVFFSDSLRSPALSLSLLQSALKLFSHNSDFSKWKYPRQKYPGNIQEARSRSILDRAPMHLSLKGEVWCPLLHGKSTARNRKKKKGRPLFFRFSKKKKKRRRRKRKRRREFFEAEETERLRERARARQRRGGSSEEQGEAGVKWKRIRT